MLLSYAIVKNKPEILLALTSLTPTEFDELLEKFDEVWNTQQETSIRKRKAGGGRKSTLNKREDQLFFILFYLKIYPIQLLQGLLFGMSQSQANHWIHRLSKILQITLDQGEHLPERDGEKLHKNLEQNESHQYIQDGCERRVQRPQDHEKQQDYYSGKKKVHTVKNHLVTHAETRRIEYLSRTVHGKKHDKKLADESNLTYPMNTTIEQDTGYQGYTNDNTIVIQPKKKQKKKELSQSEKFVNRCISSGRVCIENVISSVKRCRITKAVFRNWVDKFDDLVMEIACGLHNFRNAYRNPIPQINLLEFYFQ